MPDRRDDVDAWLSEHIEPLPPPPGTFDLIRRRARRRKYRKLALTATSAAVLVAAAVTVPQVVHLPVLNPNPSGAPLAGAGHSPTSATPTPSASRAAPSTAASSAVPVSQPPVPPDFRPTSVTFVGQDTGWVIGQASRPGHCATVYCTSVARTDDAGRTWTGVPAPLTGAPDGGTGVSQVRFLNLKHGWAYGPALYATHTGGRTWVPVDTHGLRVTDLETAGDRVFALWATCSGHGTAFAFNCTSYTLYSAPAAGGAWAPVGPATTNLTSGSASEGATLTLTRSKGYLLAPDGVLYAGPVDGSAPWQRASSLISPCAPGPARADGQPTGALLGTVNARDLILACVSSSTGSNPTVSAQQKLIYSSPNGGMSWLPMARAPAAGVAFSLAASPSASVVLATDSGIDLLPAGEVSWQTATLKGGAPAGGFGYVGMTTDEQGIALPADPSAGTVWFTFDGGQSWKPSRLNRS
jgi:hypothetical protein